MTNDNWKTLRVPPEAYKEAKAQKEEHNRTWGEQLVCNNPTTTEQPETDEIVEGLTQELDAMAFNGQVQDDKADEIIGRIKDLHTEIQKLNERLQR